ncbi:hypothetical protein Lser_V15G23610 [Lactuca serriola]
MSPAAPIEPTKKTLPESSSSGDLSPERTGLENHRRFGDLRGVQWRIDLGILPPSSSSVDEFRRVIANSRRRYAALRRRLLINPHISKDESNFRDHVMDNPLSQNPDSMWGRFFHKAELEKMVDQDLSRLYPEHGSYFQTPGCQGVLRRILLLWCIRHPNYGYRQGMHELLAPLLYVLQADLSRLSQVRKQYQDYFTDNFDGLSFTESDFEKTDDITTQNNQSKLNNFHSLDPKIQTIISFSDAYGAEGELGIILSEKFIEHDAYSIFDALMNGDKGAVAMANFFSHSQTGIPPVIEASSQLYHLLSIVDLSLYTHLVELGVEPQYFALRWLRVLFGREFALEDLLVIWDEIFSLDNARLTPSSESELNSGVLKSIRGAFISALAVSMILYLRSSLLATENATSCLQRLLNFPEDVNVGKLVKKAKSLMNVAIDAINSVHGGGARFKRSKSRSHSLPSDPGAAPPGSPGVPESYWEEKWRVLLKEEEEQKQANLHKHVRNRIKGWSERVKMRLSRTESARLLSKVSQIKTGPTQSQPQLQSPVTVTKAMAMDESHEAASVFSDAVSHIDMEVSSVASNSSVNEVASPLPVSDPPEEIFNKEGQSDNSPKLGENFRERRVLSGKFPWSWMFARNGNEGSSSTSEPVFEFDHSKNGMAIPSSSSSSSSSSCTTSKPEVVEQSLKNLARSMIENIEVIESVFQQEKDQNDPIENFVGRGQFKAMGALKELRKISDILSQM